MSKGAFYDMRCSEADSCTKEPGMHTINVVTHILLIVGGLNWGMVGFFQFDLVAALFDGQNSVLSRLVYSLVGISAVWQLIPLVKSFSFDEAAAERL
jgi:uncharacterized protein